ncbi:cobalamin-independent methionine synthase catalytic subunit [Haloactinopolyspora alba]|uniref:Cobalamin-independent methionine synthase catalytic subunit n=1 Tax=Haloactinopolyspora alba TaxID=648780 RepID=A0A2P8E9D5_9ACTN|nr:methionine synthase [Haloactinopolyspora alba]PSL06092.1 cobalamin-independent methionine synthase catalytic subunit [Haloactinopolyspora alba]
MDFPWTTGAATGVGSLPYDDRDEAARIVLGELPDLPHLPELPNRGAVASMVARTAALLIDLHVDLQPSGWRLIEREGADERRARSALAADLDALEIAGHGLTGPVKVQVCGPSTLAASLEKMRGDRAVSDHGARRDLAESLAEGVRTHVADVRRRLPGTQVLLQLDEPSLPAVLAGSIPTISGYGRLRPVEAHEAESLLALVVQAADVPVVVHSCAPDVPVSLLRRAGATAVSVDPSVLGGPVLDELAAAVDEGLAVWPGVVPSTRPATPPTERELAQRIVGLWRRLDQDPAMTAARTVVTPACGLARADAGWAREAYALASSTARAFADMAVG